MNIKITARNKEYLKISCEYDSDVIHAIKKIPGRKWLSDEKAWIYPDLDSNTQLFLAEIYKLESFNAPESSSRNNINYCIERKARITPIQEMVRWMKLKDYSQNTIKAYVKQINWFFERTALAPEDITTEDITLYIEKIKNLTGCSRTWIVQCISALKCYYNHGYKALGNNPACNIPLPKKTHNYPDILSRNEVKLIIAKGTLNIKHDFLLTLIYSAGLRVSEAVRLKTTDIDVDRMMIHIRNTKGKKADMLCFQKKLLPHMRDIKTEFFYMIGFFRVPKKTAISP